MLELGQLMADLGKLSESTKEASAKIDDQMGAALAQAGIAGDEWRAMVKRIEEAKTRWLNGVPIFSDEPIATPFACPVRPQDYTVVATDGSQIPLDRHGPAQFFVINVGLVALHYGVAERPTLASQAKLYYRDDDLLCLGPDGEKAYVGERQIAAVRTRHETQALCELIDKFAARPEILALVDGTLVLWAQEAEIAAERQQSVRDLLMLQTAARRSNSVLAGYISRPRSREVVNALKVTLFPPEVTDYNGYPAEQLPAQGLDRLTDAALFDRLLDSGQRSTVFASQSRILEEYQKQASAAEYAEPEKYKIAFFYVKVPFGSTAEIARIECPMWLAADREMLDRLHAAVVDQAEKGRGYPVALQEAHEQAVVRAPERDAFTHLVEKRCVRDGIRVTRSRKALAKQVRYV